MPNKYDEVIYILDNLDFINDNVIFMKLYAYYKLSDKQAFNDFYEKRQESVNKLSFKQQNEILYMKMNNENRSGKFIKLLLDSYSNNGLKYDIDIELFILNELIEYYEEIGKYKFSNKYLKIKLSLQDV